MPVYVAEVEGRPITAFHAEHLLEAEAAVCDGGDLILGWLGLTSQGVPLVDDDDEVRVREAVDEECEKWVTSKHRAVTGGDLDEDQNYWCMFLVPIVQAATRLMLASK